jgi:hypothetical protein
VANSGGAGKPQDKQRYLCHTCGGVTVRLTHKEAAEEQRHGHDVEPWSKIESATTPPGAGTISPIAGPCTELVAESSDGPANSLDLEGGGSR